LKRREFLKELGLGVAAGFVPLAKLAAGDFGRCKEEPGKAERPNVVYIMADDLGYGDVSCYNGESKISTPNIDSLRSQGVKFTNVHTPSAVCTPTRYGVLTGRYCWRTRLKSGVLDGYSQPLIEKGRLTWPEVMRRSGYRTACVGKWHLGIDWVTKDAGKCESFDDHERVDYTKKVNDCPNDHGFDYSFVTAACSTVDPPYVFIEDGKCTAVPGDWMERTGRVTYFASRKGPKVPSWSNEDVDPTYVRHVHDFLKKHKTEHREKSFFIYLALSSPHAPWLPPNFIKGKSGNGPRADLVSLVDWCVGQVMSDLEKLGFADDTILIFTSDNGPRVGKNGHKSAGPWRGYKSNIWEGGHRVPFIVRWPGKMKAGSECDGLMCLTDMTATFARMLGYTLGASEAQDSCDMSHLFLGGEPARAAREGLIGHSSKGVFSIQSGKWKLILDTKGSGGWVGISDKNIKAGSAGQLYDIVADPYERTDLWDERPDVVVRLKAELEKIKQQGYSRPMG